MNTVVPLCQPETIGAPLTAVLRNGVRRLLAQATRAGGGRTGAGAGASSGGTATGQNALLPIPYLRGVSMGDFQETPGALGF